MLYELDEEEKRRFQICPPKTIKGIRKIPLTSKALHALRKQKEYILKRGMIDNHTVDGHGGFVFLTKKFQLWSVVQLDIIIHKIVYDYNSIEVAAGILEDREPELLPNITAHILRQTACTRMAESGMDQRTLQEIMGHSNLAITMKVYNHVMISACGMRLKSLIRSGAGTAGHPSPAHRTQIRTQKMLQIYTTFT